MATQHHTLPMLLSNLHLSLSNVPEIIRSINGNNKGGDWLFIPLPLPHTDWLRFKFGNTKLFIGDEKRKPGFPFNGFTQSMAQHLNLCTSSFVTSFGIIHQFTSESNQALTSVISDKKSGFECFRTGDGRGKDIAEVGDQVRFTYYRLEDNGEAGSKKHGEGTLGSSHFKKVYGKGFDKGITGMRHDEQRLLIIPRDMWPPEDQGYWDWARGKKIQSYEVCMNEIKKDTNKQKP